jgi:hypothetical protein
MIKAELRRVTGDHRIARRDICAVGLKAPVKIKPGLAWVELDLGPYPLFIVYKPKPPRFA